MAIRLTVEELLAQIEAKAALLRYTVDSGMLNAEAPDGAVLAGIGDVLSEIQACAQVVRRALPVTALIRESQHHPRRRSR